MSRYVLSLPGNRIQYLRLDSAISLQIHLGTSMTRYDQIHPDMTRYMSRYVQIHFATAYNWIEYTKLDTLSDTLLCLVLHGLLQFQVSGACTHPKSVLNVPNFDIILKKTMNSIVCLLSHLQTHCGTSI